jgi:hypothetical protein
VGVSAALPSLQKKKKKLKWECSIKTLVTPKTQKPQETQNNTKTQKNPK